MLDKIKELEKEALKLEPNHTARAYLRQEVMDYSEEFLESLETMKAYVSPSFEEANWEEASIEEEGSDIRDMVSFVRTEIDRPGLNPASGGHLGYIPGGGVYPSALGDYMADISNRYAGVSFGSPGAVRLENKMIDWMVGIFGFPDTAGGTLTSGGSIANLIGIVTARDAKEIGPDVISESVIYSTAQVHHCVDKAIRIAGLGSAMVRHIPMDAQFRMDAIALKAQVEADIVAGLKPWLVVASVGTTDTGAVDPIEPIADIAEEYNLWLHLDAAYGGFFILCEETKPLFKGIDRADSLVIDPHKGLFLPYGTGAILIKDKALLYKSHYYDANYMQDALGDRNQVLSPADLSPELTRHFRGMRMWMPLRLFGLAPFRASLSEKLWLTRYFREEVSSIKGMEVGPVPELSVAFFRFVPESGDANEFNLALVKKIHEDGRVFMSSTRIQDKVYIRIATLCFRTHLSTVDMALDVVKNGVESLLAKA